MISKKQHTALGRAFRAYFEKIYDGMKTPAMKEVVYGQWEHLLKRICVVLKLDNPAFDREQFFRDCGLPTEGL